MANPTNSQKLPGTVTTAEDADQFYTIQAASEFSSLPKDVILLMMSKMGFPEVSAISLSCRGLNWMSTSEFLWGCLFSKHFPTPLPSEMTAAPTTHLQACKRRRSIDQNLTNRVFASHTLLKGVNNDVRFPLEMRDEEAGIECLVLVNGEIISYNALSDAPESDLIRTWNIETGRCAAIGRFSSLTTTCRHIANGQRILGFEDGKINILDLKTGEHLMTLEGHEEGVFCFASASNKLVSCSSDCLVKIWDLDTGKCLHSFIGHTDPEKVDDDGNPVRDPIVQMLVRNGKLFSSSTMGQIKIWELDTGVCLHAFVGDDRGKVLSFAADDDKLYAVYESGDFIIYNLETKKCLNRFEAPKHPPEVFNVIKEMPREEEEREDWLKFDQVKALVIVGDKLLMGLDWGKIIVFDLNTNAYIGALQTTCPAEAEITGAVASLLFVDGKLYAGFDEGALKVFDFSAPDKIIFEQIANQFKSWNPDQHLEAMEQFSRMPEKAKKSILLECGDKADIAPAEKAQAIDSYLKTLSKDETPPSEWTHLGMDFLSVLGISTSEQCVSDLGCKPEFLKHVGMISAMDLDGLGLDDHPVSHLEMPKANATFPSDPIELSKALLSEHRDILYFLKGMENSLHSKALRDCRYAIYSGGRLENPWPRFLGSLGEFYTQIEVCNSINGLIRLFQLENHVALVTRINIFVDIFNELNQKTQQERLYAYLSIKGLRMRWEGLHAQGISSFSELAYKHPEIVQEFLQSAQHSSSEEESSSD